MPNVQSKKPSKKKVRAAALKRLEERYFNHFLPLVFSKRRAKEFLSFLGPKTRTWESKKSGKVAVFLPPPANIKDEPTEKPERLGKTIKQLAWCRKQTLDGKIKLAQTVLKSLLAATDQVAVAFSGGRDSLVALHLMLQLKPDVPVMLANTGIEFPESLNYIRQLAKTWKLNFHEAKAGVNFWQLADEQGLPVAGRGNTTFMKDLAAKAEVKLSNSCCRRMKETPARQFYKEHNIEGVVTGLRVEESLMRKLNFADYGALRYSSTYNTLISWPLYAWSDDDIERYITLHNLPRNPLYSLGYNRVGCWPCLQDMFYADSRVFTLKKEHPHLYRTVQKKFGSELASLFNVWSGLEDWELDEDDFEILYRSCMFEVLEGHRHDQDTYRPYIRHLAKLGKVAFYKGWSQNRVAISG